MKYKVTNKHSYLKDGIILDNYSFETNVYYTECRAYWINESVVNEWAKLGWVIEKKQEAILYCIDKGLTLEDAPELDGHTATRIEYDKDNNVYNIYYEKHENN